MSKFAKYDNLNRYDILKMTLNYIGQLIKLLKKDNAELSNGILNEQYLEERVQITENINQLIYELSKQEKIAEDVKILQLKSQIKEQGYLLDELLQEHEILTTANMRANKTFIDVCQNMLMQSAIDLSSYDKNGTITLKKEMLTSASISKG